MTDAVPMTVLKVSHHSAAHIAARYPYAAYGSNLSMQQITERCPKVELMIGGKLLDYRLDFAKVATITADKDSSVPVGIYKLNQHDIERLDRKEGMGRVYDRYLITVITDDSRALRCFTYIKRDNVLQPPSADYFQRLLTGYRDWHFEDRRLRHARQRAADAWQANEPARKAAEEKRSVDRFLASKFAGTAGQAWAQGEMWEPEGNVVPIRSNTAMPRYVAMAHNKVEWGQRGGEFYFRAKNGRVWYRDVSGHDDIQSGMVRGELAQNLPGAQAYRPVDNKKGKP